SVEAVNRIYEIKGRKLTSPLAICVGDVSDIGRFVVTDHLPFGLLESLLPGPVTVVLTRVIRLGTVQNGDMAAGVP
nr:YrdC domain-containing protein, mitochondrial isoform X2 [Tanacetum cinerariifolium]